MPSITNTTKTSSFWALQSPVIVDLDSHNDKLICMFTLTSDGGGGESSSALQTEESKVLIEHLVVFDNLPHCSQVKSRTS